MNDNYTGARSLSDDAATSKMVWEKSGIKEEYIIKEYFKKATKMLEESTDFDSEMISDIVTRELIKPDPLRTKVASINLNGEVIDLPAFRINKRLGLAAFKYLLKNQNSDNQYKKIVKEIVKETEDYAKGDKTLENERAEDYHSLIYQRKDFSRFGENANLINSITSDGIASPFWKHYMDTKGFDYNNLKSYKMHDNQTVKYYTKKEKGDC